MRKFKLLSLLLALTMILSMSACDSTAESKYRITADGLYKEEFAIGFRLDDGIQAIVSAALDVLIADGTAGGLSRKWFGSDIITIKGDIDALDELLEELGDDGIPERDLIMGFNPGAMPMSFKGDDGEYTGFDIELAQRVCELVGWSLTLLPINAEDIVIELNSGNVDCAWGGMSFEGLEGKLSTTASYLKSEKVLVTIREEGYTSLKKLNDAVLSITFDPVSSALLETTQELKDSFSTVKKLNGIAECFQDLDSGGCDAILIDKLSAEYYILK